MVKHNKPIVMKRLMIMMAAIVFDACSNESDPSKFDIEYSWWGEDIVYNESGQDFEMTVYSIADTTVNVPTGESFKLYHPNFDWHTCVTWSDSLKINFADGTEIKAKKGDLIYEDYTKEENDYWFTIDGKEYLEDRKYPVYHYRIKKSAD